MVKPKGVWLETAELSEIKSAQIVTKPVSGIGTRQQPQGKSRRKKPLLTLALAVCCCVLLLLVGLHAYPALFPDTGQAPVQAAAQVEPVHEEEISLPADTLSEDSALSEDDTLVAVSRVYSQVEIETEEIPPVRNSVDDATMPAGTTKVLTEGEPGVLENTISITYRDGEEISREIISSRVLKEPGVTTVAQGVALASRAGESAAVVEAGSEPDTISVDGTELTYSRRLSVESTAYTWTGNTTATGSWPDRGTVAVDPRVIPLGSKLYVEGYGFATATDTGGAIKGNIIDVYFPSYDECIQWGRKRGLTVYILE